MNTKEIRALEFVKKFMKRSRAYTQPYFDKFDRLFNIYLSKQSKFNITNPFLRANLKLPYAFQVIETLRPQILEALFGEKPYLSLRGRGVEDIENAEIMTDFLTFQIDNIGIVEKFWPYLSSLLIYGTAVAKIPWVTKTRSIRKKTKKVDPATSLEITVLESEDDVYYDGPDFQAIPITDFFPDPNATSPNIQEMRGCVHRMKRSWHDLKKNERRLVDGEWVGVYSNLDELKTLATDSSGEPSSSVRPDEHEQERASALGKDLSEVGLDEIEVWEYWGEFSPSDGAPPVEYVITVANEEVVIRCEVNPLPAQLKPFVSAVDYLVENEFYGIGEIEQIEGLIQEGTALRNARLDAANLALNRMYVADRTAGINGRSIYSRPGGIIWSNDINAIKPLDPPEVMGSSYRETSQIEYDIQNTSAVINASQPSSNLGKAFSRTATGINYFQKFTSGRIAAKIQLIEAFTLKPLVEIITHYNREFITSDQVVRVLNKNFDYRSLPIDSFQRQYDYQPIAIFDRITKSDRQQEFAMVLQSLIPLIQSNAQLFDIPTFVSDALKEYSIGRDPSRYLNKQLLNQPPGGMNGAGADMAQAGGGSGGIEIPQIPGGMGAY